MFNKANSYIPLSYTSNILSSFYGEKSNTLPFKNYGKLAGPLSMPQTKTLYTIKNIIYSLNQGSPTNFIHTFLCMIQLSEVGSTCVRVRKNILTFSFVCIQEATPISK